MTALDEILQDNGIELTNSDNIDELLKKVNKKVNVTPKEALSLLNNSYTGRFNGAPWFKDMEKYSVILYGVGGLGSHFAYSIARTGISNISLCDMDTVEAHNLSGQLFSKNDIRSPKSLAMCKFLNDYTDIKNIVAKTVSDTQVEFNYNCTNIVVCALDNMETRKRIFEKVKNTSQENRPPLFIDLRGNPEYCVIYAIPMDSQEAIAKYEEEFFSDGEAEAGVCSYKQTTYMANMCASLGTNALINFVQSRELPLASLPYKVIYEANNFKLESFYL